MSTEKKSFTFSGEEKIELSMGRARKRCYNKSVLRHGDSKETLPREMWPCPRVLRMKKGKRKMKKCLYAILSVGLCLSLAGCSGQKDSKETKTVKESQNVTGTKESKTSGNADSKWEYKEAELTIALGNNINTAGYEAVFALAEEKLGIHVEMEISSSDDVANLYKTRLAAGDAADLIAYNSGALLQSLNPGEYFLEIGGEEWTDRLDEAYKESVTVDGKMYGIPESSAYAAVVLYNKDIYEKYHLEVPKTWDEFLSNCDILKKAGEVAVIGSFGDSWTAQIPYLGDHYNVVSEEPDFVEKFEQGKAKYAESQAGLKSWQKLVDLNPYYNKDYLATSYSDACDMIVNGEGAHYFATSTALSSIYGLYGDRVNNVRAFPILGEKAEEAGLTVWMPSSIYGNKNSDKTEVILRFMEFYISDEALDAYSGAIMPDGPYCVKGYEMSDKAYDAVRLDMQPYFDEGKTVTAMEFVTSVKGANCPAICQECGSGQTTALEAAGAYDEDCKKQAAQLGLNWE